MINADFAEKVRVFSPVVVFIDDGFAAAKLDQIDADDWASLRTESSSGFSPWAKLQAEHFPSLRSVMDLKREAKELSRAWDLYVGAPDVFKLFDPIFKKIAAARETAIRRLREIIAFLEQELELTVCRHPDIPSAAEDIKRSKLVFLDFFLYQQSTTEKAIEDVKSFQEIFSSKVDEGGEQYNRVLFLISTQLPASESIERFRNAATVKAAFFKPVPKDSLSKDWFIEAFGKILHRYSDLHRLARYLEVFSEQMKRDTESLRADLEALELHDLAILDHMRLKADGENLGNYMSWLMSEALAARIRASAPMIKASEEVSAVSRPPFHGMLSPNQVLFSWFAEISFAPFDKNPGELKVNFGDVFSVDGKGDGSDIPSRDLILVIAPACDLQRVECTYEALCVRGSIAKQTPNLSDLLEQRTLGKDKVSGRYKNLLQRKLGGKPNYVLVEWYPENITTIPITALRGTGYSRLARLNELFSQEIKEDALRQVGRVGVQVDPSFNVGLGATIAYKPKRRPDVHIEIPDSDMVSGIFTFGNANNSRRIFVSEEFLDFFEGLVGKIDPSSDASLKDVSTKFEEGLKVLLEVGGKGFELSSNQFMIGKGFTIKFQSEFTRGAVDVGFCGVYFYPHGSVKDPVVEVAAAPDLPVIVDQVVS